VGLAQEDSVTVLVWTAKLLYVLVGLLVPCQSLTCRKGLVTSLCAALEWFLSSMRPHVNGQLRL